MHKLRAGFLALLCLVMIAGCTTNLSPGNILFTTKAALQLAVGTQNDSAGTLSLLTTGTSTPGTFLNTVATFRNQNGVSAYLQPGTATLGGPASLSVPVGGIFSYGQAPGANGVVGLAPAYNPPNGNGIGYATGFIFTGAPATAGAYSLSTTVTVNGVNIPYSASATLPASHTVLGNEAPPSYASGGASGGGTFTVSVPAGVIETLIAVYDASTGAPVATAKTTTTTATLPSGTLTQGNSYLAIAIGADYPLVEAGPPASTAMKPTLTGAGGTADLTASGFAGFVQ